MSTEVIYKVRVHREGSVVRALALACSSNCFPKPKPTDEPDWELFAEDPSTPAGLENITNLVTRMSRSADGGCLRERSRHFEGPAYYRLWRRRLRKVGVELPPPEPAKVRYEEVERPEKPQPRVSYREYLGRSVEFSGSPLRCCATGRSITRIVILGAMEETAGSRRPYLVEAFEENGTFIRAFRMTWARLYTLIRGNKHVLRTFLPGVYAGPVLIRAGAALPMPCSLPPAGSVSSDGRLAVLQAAVGGSIEIVDGEDGRQFVVNEDGIGLGLARNELATQEARAALAISAFDYVKGNCVILPTGDA